MDTDRPRQTAITLDEARMLLVTEPEGSKLWAAANTIVSLYTANNVLTGMLDGEAE